MTKDGERFWLTGLLSWDTDDLSPSSPDSERCRVTRLPSVFSDIRAMGTWLEEATDTKRV